MKPSTDCSKYQSLRVRAYFRSAVVSDPWLPLDGALFYQHVRRDLGAQQMTTSGLSPLAQPKGNEIKGGRLPIAIVHAKDWYYRCSWAQWGPYVEGQDYWSKRFDQTHASLIDFRGRRGKIDIRLGAYKAYRMPMYYRSVLWVDWYCYANLDALSPLVHITTHLGKKTSQGWGRVLRWEIEPVDEDYSIWKEGKLMRGIPLYHLPKDKAPDRLGEYGIRPSYWDWRNQMQLELPDVN